jgi:ubiquinone/menaquinone biosynthesis C-methylase UbiE
LRVITAGFCRARRRRARQTGGVQDWWLDERAHAGAEHLDAVYVAGYDRKAGYDPAEDVAELASRGIGAGATVVDLGAGTGAFATALAPHVQRVIAVDVSPAMVAALTERLRHGNLVNVMVIEGGFLSYQHRGEPADAIFTRNALHQVPDFWKGIALQRMAGMLRPGGLLRLRDLVFDFEPAGAVAAIDAWLAGAVEDPASGWTAAELAEHVRIEYSTYRWLLELLLDKTGFEILDVSYRRAAYGAYTCRLRDRGQETATPS